MKKKLVSETGFRAAPSGRTGKPVSDTSFSGFTLIEVLVVVAILGILAALVIPRIMDRPDEAKRSAAKIDVGTIVQALKLYRLDNGMYPSTDQGLAALVQRPTSNPVPPNWKQGGYLEHLPRDPWGGDYQYLSPGVRGEIDVYSLGADRARGGEGNAADIGNWD
ncbi:MAG TPA: type II secretion system major pseudopilin GspG [Usitatibacter sp.]|nr:type II secretion system major pseudopilin GspG [Usitatibacter sp.]